MDFVPTAIHSNSYSYFTHTNPLVDVEGLTGVCAEAGGGIYGCRLSNKFLHFHSPTQYTPPMTVQELIAKLSEYPSNLTVVVSGYERGVSEAAVSPRVVKVIPNANQGVWYFGEHEEGPEGTVEVVKIG